MVFYNTEAVFGSVINGITIAMEEQKAKGAPIDDETITSVKSGLMDLWQVLRFLRLGNI